MGARRVGEEVRGQGGGRNRGEGRTHVVFGLPRRVVRLHVILKGDVVGPGLVVYEGHPAHSHIPRVGPSPLRDLLPLLGHQREKVVV
jgi:hypothetical protein